MTYDDCIISGKVKARGYAYSYHNGKRISAHRLSYLTAKGEIPEGLVIDHLCHTAAVQRGECQSSNECVHRSCVNPAHLEAITPAENVLRGWKARFVKTECKNGHDITDPSAYYLRNRGVNGQRECKECCRISMKAYRARRKADV